jgi:hypothetical protein
MVNEKLGDRLAGLKKQRRQLEIRIDRLEYAISHVLPHRERLTRPDGTDPAGFSARVAAAFLEAHALSSSPAKILAQEAGVPVGTVHRWIRDARRAGHLPPVTKGAR